jgi:hypothetical protein
MKKIKNGSIQVSAINSGFRKNPHFCQKCMVLHFSGYLRVFVHGCFKAKVTKNTLKMSFTEKKFG